MTCECCGAMMRKRSSWRWFCDVCRFQSSDLKPSPGTGIAGLEHLRRENYQVLLNRLEKIKPLQGLKVLEIGCAWGWFLEMASERGAIVTGLEPEEPNAKLTQAKGFEVLNDLFPSKHLQGRKFDVIIFNDVFEHIPKPSMAVQHIQDLLASDGVLVLNYPSSNGFLFKLAELLSFLGVNGPIKRLWQWGMASPHVSYFNPANLKALVTRHSSLDLTDQFRLKSVSRNGLIPRIKASYSGFTGIFVLCVIYLLSFILELFDSDIEASFFEFHSK